jgi:glycosyltransferase involved in cell wall biosynthesis
LSIDNYQLMKLSLIIPSLNAPGLAQTVEAVLGQTRPPDEIIVVGRDEQGILKHFPSVLFVDTLSPIWPSAARNRGMAQASGDIFLFLDADCLPRPGWIAAHEQRHLQGEQVVGGAVVIGHESYWVESDNLSMFHEFVPEQAAGYRFFLPTLNLSVGRTVVEQVGELDESLRTAEDMDWTIRMRQAGFRLYFEPQAVVLHNPPRTTWAGVAAHWQTTGHNSIRVRLRYADEFKTPGFARRASWLRWFSPLLAAGITWRIYANPLFWRYWRSLPVVYATKILYCLGAAQGIKNGSAAQLPCERL